MQAATARYRTLALNFNSIFGWAARTHAQTGRGGHMVSLPTWRYAAVGSRELSRRMRDA